MSRRRDPERFLARLWAMEAELVKAGLPPMPEWWRREVSRFYRTGKRRLVVRKGRRVFASTCVAPRLAVAEMLFGEHVHHPGTPPIVYAFLSVKRDEAANRLRGVRAILEVLGEKYTERGDTIELNARPALFAVLTASFKLSVGDTVGFAWCDEVARWNDEGANPADEVIGTLAPALSTLPNAKLFLISSPLATVDAHARAFELGETDLQSVAFGETWTINPSLSEADCRALEPEDRLFRREYAAIPSAAISAAFEQLAIDRGFAHTREHAASHQRVLIVDPSSGRKDTWSWAVVSWVEPQAANSPPPAVRVRVRYVPGSVQVDGLWYARDERVEDYFVQRANGEWVPYEPAKSPDPFLLVHEMDGVDGAFFDQVPADEMVARLADVCRHHGIDTVHSDQREEYALASLFAKHRLTFRPHAYTSTSKADGMAHLRRWLAEGRLALPHHERLRTELLQFEERITPSGAITFGARGSGHDDFVCLLLTAAIADLERGLPGSPTRAPNVRTEVPGK